YSATFSRRVYWPQTSDPLLPPSTFSPLPQILYDNFTSLLTIRGVIASIASLTTSRTLGRRGGSHGLPDARVTRTVPGMIATSRKPTGGAGSQNPPPIDKQGYRL